jgi:ribonuclease HI
LWGVLEGLKYAKRKGYRKIELNINSVAVMKVIKSGKTSNSLGFSLVKSIKKLLDEEREVKISHLYRETNRSADALASMGCTLNFTIVYFETCPINIRELIHADVLGSNTPRLILL